MTQSPPEYLKTTSVALANQTFQDVTYAEAVDEIHGHLSRRHGLLCLVISARKLHHSHFFAETYDYGHQVWKLYLTGWFMELIAMQHYLDNLQNQKFIVNHALEQLERRKAAILYEKENWFQWVRERQDEEEAQRENEKKKIRREAALWKRHWKLFQSRMKTLSERENEKRQDEFLSQAYNERISAEEAEMWDPIEDLVEDERGSYLDMVKMFLMRELECEAENIGSKPMDEEAPCSGALTTTDAKSANKKSRKKSQKDKTSEAQAQGKTDKTLPETRLQMQQR